jgi:hypothetical protein
MAPDLVYAMLQSFDTEIQVYLDGADGKVNSKYVDYDTGTDINLEDIRDSLEEEYPVAASLINSTAILNGTSTWGITKTVAQALLEDDELGLTSPPTCTSAAQDEVIIAATVGSSSNILGNYGISTENDNIYSLNDDYSGYTFLDEDGNKTNFDVNNITILCDPDEQYKSEDFNCLSAIADENGYQTAKQNGQMMQVLFLQILDCMNRIHIE